MSSHPPAGGSGVRILLVPSPQPPMGPGGSRRHRAGGVLCDPRTRPRRELSETAHRGPGAVILLGACIHSGRCGIPVPRFRKGSRSGHLPVRGPARGLRRLEGRGTGQLPQGTG